MSGGQGRQARSALPVQPRASSFASQPGFGQRPLSSPRPGTSQLAQRRVFTPTTSRTTLLPRRSQFAATSRMMPGSGYRPLTQRFAASAAPRALPQLSSSNAAARQTVNTSTSCSLPGTKLGSLETDGVAAFAPYSLASLEPYVHPPSLLERQLDSGSDAWQVQIACLGGSSTRFNRAYRDALQPYKQTSLTVAGRALTKHPVIAGHSDITLRQSIRTDVEINVAARNSLRNFMRNGSVDRHYQGRFGDVIDYTMPNGSGARFRAIDNSFIGFLEPKRKR